MESDREASGGESEADDLDVPIMSGVRQRRARGSTSQRGGRGARLQDQERHMIGGEVVRSMKRGLATRRGETRTKVLLYLAVGMFVILSTYWLIRINRKTGIIPSLI